MYTLSATIRTAKPTMLPSAARLARRTRLRAARIASVKGDVDPRHRLKASAAKPSPVALNLPRALARPSNMLLERTTDVVPRSLLALNPELAGVPSTYVRETLSEMGHE